MEDEAGWIALPPEIFCMILQNCSAKRAILLERVCKRWSEYFSEEMWKKILSPSQLSYCSLENQQWSKRVKSFVRARLNMKKERCVVYELFNVPDNHGCSFTLGNNKVHVTSRLQNRRLINLSSHKSDATFVKSITHGYQILDSSGETVSVLDETTGATFNIELPPRLQTIGNLIYSTRYLPNNDVNYPSIIRIDEHKQLVCVINLKERVVSPERSMSMEYLDNLLQLHGKYFALPTHPHRIEVIDTETNITVASLPRYEYNETLFALGDNRILYTAQLIGGIGWKLVDFKGNVVNEANWPTEPGSVASTPCFLAAILADDLIVIGSTQTGHLHFIDALKKKELCALRLLLDFSFLIHGRFDRFSPMFSCFSPGRLVICDDTSVKVIDFESQHMLVKRAVVVLNTDGTYESVKTSACRLMKLAKEKIRKPQIRARRIWETSTVRLSMITSRSDQRGTVNELATKLYNRRKRNDVIPGIDAHMFGAVSIEDFSLIPYDTPPSKITDNAIIIKEELVDGEWQLADYEYTEKHFK